MRNASARLSLMMFLEFFVWGAWYVTVGNYMTAIGMTDAIFWAYTVNPIAAIAAPFFLGMVADRFFATERVLGVMHLLGGLALLAAPGFRDNPTLFVGMLLVHSLCFMPTLGLANSLAFTHIKSQEKQFPLIRVFGTIGWIVAGVLVSAVLHADRTATPLYVGGAAALVLGLYSFTLPHTPPPLAGQRTTARQVLGLDALSQLASRPFTVFIVSSLLICIPLAAYYAYAPVFVNAAGIENPAFKMSFGQMSETAFMLAMPLLFARLGVKWMLLVGMAAWVARYALFAAAAPAAVTWMILVGIALHGICYDFFFVSGQIYVDKRSPPAIRGQAQGFLVLVTYGVGMLIGSLIAGAIFNRVVGTGAQQSLTQWQTFWWIPAAFAAAVMVFFALFFHDRVAEERTGADAARVGRVVAAEQQP
ncbi:MAG TPA: MFS transporter [Gemmatimonadaceae bacterium]|nr:MFS transporter [Gemmatimonadaceae bacterium]